MKTTNYISVLGATEVIQISRLIDAKGHPYSDAFLEIKPFDKDFGEGSPDNLWEDIEYILKIYKALKHRLKGSSYYKEFKKYCLEHGLNFKATKKEYLQVTEQAIKLKMFKKLV